MSHWLLFLLLALSSAGHAATVSSCQADAKKLKDDCDQKLQATNKPVVSATKDKGAGAVGANQQGNMLSAMTDANNTALGEVVKKCEESKKSCAQKCDENGASESEKPQLKKLKEKCEKDIQGSIDSAKDGISDGKDAIKGANETGKQAGADAEKKEDSSGGGGAPPPMQPPQQQQQSKDDKKTSDTAKTDKSSSAVQPSTVASVPAGANATDPAAASTVDCKGNPGQAYSDSRCLKDMTAGCASGAVDAGTCQKFRDLYCNKSASSAVPPTFSGGIYQKLAGGSGAGSAFCLQPASLAFCKDSAHSGCPSCAKARGETVNMASVNGATCGGDPLFSSPSAVAALKSQSTGGGAAGGGGGGSSSSAGSIGGAAGLDADKLKGLGQKEGQANGLGSLAAGDGGGGGSSYHGGAEPESLTYDPAADRRTASVGVPGVTDVEFRRTQPMVFSILDSVMRTRCAKNQFLYPCGKR